MPWNNRKGIAKGQAIEMYGLSRIADFAERQICATVSTNWRTFYSTTSTAQCAARCAAKCSSFPTATRGCNRFLQAFTA